MIKEDIRNITYDYLIKYLESINEKSFRADQIFDWIYNKKAKSFSDMKNLPKELICKLRNDFSIVFNDIIKKEQSSDGTIKILFGMKNGGNEEVVLIPTEKRLTICISTQVGCKFGCNFCASGINGFKRNLSTAEIIDQIVQAKEIYKDKKLTHIVFMGVGEPLDNYENLIKVIRIINSKKGINIGARRITVSTCGIIPKIKKFAEEGMQIELAISLHGSNNKIRSELMPINKKYPLKDLIATAKEYSIKTKRQITFEYILIKDITCTRKSAKELASLLKGLLCKVNLIAYNKVPEFLYNVPSSREMLAFKDTLSACGIRSTLRMPRGRDISGACGQLRYKLHKESKRI